MNYTANGLPYITQLSVSRILWIIIYRNNVHPSTFVTIVISMISVQKMAAFDSYILSRSSGLPPVLTSITMPEDSNSALMLE